MEPNALVFRHAHGGVFVAHYYAYTDSMSTFVAECDGDSWEQCGLATMTDRERRDLVENIFAAELDGSPLIENKSEWRQFSVLSNERWIHDNIVLLGRRAARRSFLDRLGYAPCDGRFGGAVPGIRGRRATT